MSKTINKNGVLGCQFARSVKVDGKIWIDCRSPEDRSPSQCAMDCVEDRGECRWSGAVENAWSEDMKVGKR
jgi:hypothetical protein